MERVFKSLEKFNELIALVSGCGVIVIALVLFGSALARYLLRSPIGLSVEFSAILFYVLTLSAMAYTLQVGGHVNFSLVLERLTGRKRASVELLSGIITLVIFGLMTLGGWGLFWRSIAKGWNATDTGWPMAYFQWALPFGLALLSIEGLIIVLRHALALFSGKKT